jgi:hypothetical protein
VTDACLCSGDDHVRSTMIEDSAALVIGDGIDVAYDLFHCLAELIQCFHLTVDLN